MDLFSDAKKLCSDISQELPYDANRKAKQYVRLTAFRFAVSSDITLGNIETEKKSLTTLLEKKELGPQQIIHNYDTLMHNILQIRSMTNEPIEQIVYYVKKLVDEENVIAQAASEALLAIAYKIKREKDAEEITRLNKTIKDLINASEQTKF